MEFVVDKAMYILHINWLKSRTGEFVRLLSTLKYIRTLLPSLKLYLYKRSGKMWNLIRSLRGGRHNCQSDISSGDLEHFYVDKFSVGTTSSETIRADKVNILRDVTYDDLYFYEERMKRYIDKMKLGSAHGIDGIMSEHLKYASNCTSLVHQICVLFTICLKYGIVPDSFTRGLIVPILKKSTCNPSIANSYRPVLIQLLFLSFRKCLFSNSVIIMILVIYNLVLSQQGELIWLYH